MELNTTTHITLAPPSITHRLLQLSNDAGKQHKHIVLNADLRQTPALCVRA
jgi:hypothetical protein